MPFHLSLDLAILMTFIELLVVDVFNFPFKTSNISQLRNSIYLQLSEY